jgi:hypothetical protein
MSTEHERQHQDQACSQDSATVFHFREATLILLPPTGESRKVSIQQQHPTTSIALYKHEHSIFFFP